MNGRYVAYLRVSTAEQGESGLGLDAQRNAIEQHIKARDGELVRIFLEVASGTDTERQELKAAIRECQLCGCNLLVARWDRLSRDTGHLMTMRSHSGVVITSVDAPDEPDMMVALRAAWAAEERRLISIRTKQALAAAKARGVRLGNPDNLTDKARRKGVEIHQRKADNRNRIYFDLIQNMSAAADEPLSLNETARRLNAAGYRTPRGAEFQAVTVKRIVERFA